MPNSLSENELMVAHENKGSGLSRRNFFGYAGVATALFAGLSACNRTNIQPPPDGAPTVGADGTVDLGSGDIGILNYAYALEQLEAAFYTKVISSQYAGITALELSRLTDIRDHEIAHREFFKTVLKGMLIPDLEVDFSTIDFGSRASVLGTAKAFEDLGVSAYNGAGRLIANPDYLVLAGKIVSVEARHAACIRDFVGMTSFADDTIVDAMGLDVTRKPLEVLPIAAKYIKTKITANNLGTY